MRQLHSRADVASNSEKAKLTFSAPGWQSLCMEELQADGAASALLKRAIAPLDTSHTGVEPVCTSPRHVSLDRQSG